IGDGLCCYVDIVSAADCFKNPTRNDEHATVWIKHTDVLSGMHFFNAYLDAIGKVSRAVPGSLYDRGTYAATGAGNGRRLVREIECEQTQVLRITGVGRDCAIEHNVESGTGGVFHEYDTALSGASGIHVNVSIYEVDVILVI